MRKQAKPVNDNLPPSFYSIPGMASTTVSTKELKAILKKNDGYVFSCGRFWEFQAKKLPAGMHRITLTPKEHGAPL